MPTPPWLQALDPEDLQFIRRFVLASGSLKAIAAEYGVSYPTVRLRLDRLIARVRGSQEWANLPPFERRARMLLAEGRIGRSEFDELLAAHEEDRRCE